MQSEFCSHIGLNANQKYRVCHVGGPEKDMFTEIGYLSLFEVSHCCSLRLRSADCF